MIAGTKEEHKEKDAGSRKYRNPESHSDNRTNDGHRKHEVSKYRHNRQDNA